MEKLTEKIEYYLIDFPEKHPEEANELKKAKTEDNWIYPFSQVEMDLAALLATGTITFEQYLELKADYEKRNRFLFTYEMSGPRTFGETWAQQYLQAIVPELQKPSQALDPNYSGEYDLWCDDIRIEVKASRAVKRKSGGKLIEKALNTQSDDGFDMNFQQIKPACCEVFVWMGVWRDEIRYWVLSSSEVVSNKYYSQGQHRGNQGEGQLWIKDTNITDFDKYLVRQEDLLDAIREKGTSAEH